MNKSFLLPLSLICCVLLSACGNQVERTPDKVPDQIYVHPTEFQTPPGSKPTGTPHPTNTPIPNLDIPNWVSDPDVDVLLTTRTALDYKTQNLALVNSASGEVFNLPNYLKVGGYFWMSDGQHFGILSLDKSNIILVDTATGEVTYHYPSKSAVRLAFTHTDPTDPPYPYQSIGQTVEDPGFMLVNYWYAISADKRYIIYQEEYDYSYTSVLDLHTNKVDIVTDKDDGIFDMGQAWSPTGSFLGIVHNDEAPGAWFSFEKDPNFRLTIYDVEHGYAIVGYDNIPEVIWSPDGTKLLYSPWDKSSFGRENPPCIFDTLTGVTQCYNEAVVRHTTATTTEVTFSSLQWSPDGKMVGYVYSTVEWDPYDENGGICLIEIENNSIHCMLEELPQPDPVEGYIQQGFLVISYQWSPNGNYLIFRMDESCPYCDYSTEPQIGIVNIKTGEYFMIGGIHGGQRGQLGVWRP